METTAFACLGLTPDQLYNITLREYHNMLEGYKMRELKKARYIQYIINPHYKKLPSEYEIANIEKPIEAHEKMTKEEVEQMKREILGMYE